MAIFNKPTNLNGAELKQELAAVGIVVSEITDNGDGTIRFDTKDSNLAASIVAAHNGTTNPPEPTIEQKLASVGLTIDDLKAVLGL